MSEQDQTNAVGDMSLEERSSLIRKVSVPFGDDTDKPDQKDEEACTRHKSDTGDTPKDVEQFLNKHLDGTGLAEDFCLIWGHIYNQSEKISRS